MDIQANYLEKILGDNQEAKFAIREVPHFGQCSDDLIDLIYSYGRIYSLQKDETLTREGEFDQWVYFILGGKLAVLVGGEQVDTISSSLVGERCIFGEPRKATLSASDGGVTALGIDMAILDTLRGGNGNSSENVPVYAELLSIITEEIIDRIADLTYVQLDVASKLAINIQSDDVADIVTGLIGNSYSGDPRINIAVYKFLMKRDKALLALSLQPDRITVDTRKLHSHCVNMGNPELTLELAQAIYEFRQEGNIAAAGSGGYAGGRNFHGFVREAFEKIAEQYEAHKSDRGMNRELTETGWRDRFRMGSDMHINLAQTRDWLREAFHFTDLQVVEALVTILQLASSYTAEINKTNKEMMVELSQIKGLKKLESVAEGGEIVLSVLFDTRTPEEMIPMFSKHVLDVHLINPYLERLAESAPAAVKSAQAPLVCDAPAVPSPDGTPPDSTSGGEAKNLLDSLFD